MNVFFDVVVVGGGASGIMAAGQAALRGFKVLLLEKNNSLGRKILLTGNERCNLTHADFDLRKLVKIYGENGSFLFSAFHRFGPKEVMNFFEEQGVKLKIEQDGRVFPQSDSAQEVVTSLKRFLLNVDVTIWFGAEVKKINTEEKLVEEIILVDGRRIKFKNLIIATGGLSYPSTGSSGDGFKIAKDLGLKIVPTSPALVPLKIRETWVTKLSGVSLQNVELSVLQNDKKNLSKKGEMIFTHFGISGPLVLNMSKDIIARQTSGGAKISLNLMPNLNVAELDKRIQENLEKEGKKKIRTVLENFIPRALVMVILEKVGIDFDLLAANINKENRTKLREALTNLKMTVSGNLGYNLAIVTSGGVSLKEIDPKTMHSKLYNNLYFVGEVLDIDGPTGGYNLQAAWSTGFLAGNYVK